jgi:hypothetical protein
VVSIVNRAEVYQFFLDTLLVLCNLLGPFRQQGCFSDFYQFAVRQLIGNLFDLSVFLDFFRLVLQQDAGVKTNIWWSVRNLHSQVDNPLI